MDIIGAAIQTCVGVDEHPYGSHWSGGDGVVSCSTRCHPIASQVTLLVSPSECYLRSV